MASELYNAGVRRLNISLDTLNEEKFVNNRWGKLEQVLSGYKKQKSRPQNKNKRRCSKGVNDEELADMITWCGQEGFDMTIIEVMPMGDIGSERRLTSIYLFLVRSNLSRKFNLIDIPERTAGPARYVKVQSWW